MFDAHTVKEVSSTYVKPADFHPTYGTAGFRSNASLLTSTVFRCGLLAAARALLLNANTGLMITASHNPVGDNGVKMVDPDGGMMPQSFEAVAAELANCEDDDAVVAVLRDRVFAQSASGNSPSVSAPDNLTVHVGHDTRPSAPVLLAAAIAGVRALNVQAHSYGCVTTPQLHFLVHAANQNPPHRPSQSTASQTALQPLQTYFDAIVGADRSHGGPLFVDCANGVGAEQLQKLVPALHDIGVELRLRNTGQGGGQLNHRCGADFVQKDRLPPSEFEDVPPGARCCSVDGDADRLVYFSLNLEAADGGAAEGGGGTAAPVSPCRGISLLDGDKVAMLAAVYIRDSMNQLPAELLHGVCCVQTAYANGAATAYLRDVLQLPTVCTPTGGVKYLHEAAHSADLGIYFESNGHGTVLFSKALVERLRTAAAHVPAARELLLLSQLINQTVGDAISGILLVELILRRKGWTLAEWQALYSDLPSRQLKLQVADRSCITTADAERVCVAPVGLQDAITRVVSLVPHGRAFVRPSGTEDAVRVYAEANTQEQADELARQVARLVYDMAGGVGPRP
ncbi:hypothetical protein VOLCADRAFT_82053 [Volvox carteri f. nagariensis]|uniref:Phosphoacetylglucosamine mutase n=1 Tax=Volvox carteri f. nagariensis TaxID=3068 RepID=D8U2X1_VOLCA|nr:uncharacterized protein VOLCADRAFT_82053 [Volvox carteri f. nagariensis]EFJ45974.1 hypothetical protein VOLCADRAFT_82053 [Volvox carteri f. nagariensis]|eukprot:XP_002953052.1 hypothetical protein VOLCADRAFT_82053 [Volvox carteri f. nagariensis]